jgi:hypothetical protein
MILKKATNIHGIVERALVLAPDANQKVELMISQTEQM